MRRQVGEFPAASRGSVPDIYHTSLARICFAPSGMTPAELAQVTEACEHASAAIRGTRRTFDSLWFVAESEEGALVAPEPSSPEERAMPRRKGLPAVTRVRSGSIVALKIED